MLFFFLPNEAMRFPHTDANWKKRKKIPKNLTMTGSTLRPQSVAAKAAIAADLRAHVWPMLEAGRIAPVMDETFPLADATGAHARMEAGDHIGKIVLEVANG